MGEPTEFLFDYKEVAELLVKKQDLHEGIWELRFHFGLNAGCVGPSDDHLTPTAFVGIVKVSLALAEKETNMSVNAAKVNPTTKHLPVRKRSK